jgi:hypothetical protein
VRPEFYAIYRELYDEDPDNDGVRQLDDWTRRHALDVRSAVERGIARAARGVRPGLSLRPDARDFPLRAEVRAVARALDTLRAAARARPAPRR